MKLDGKTTFVKDSFGLEGQDATIDNADMGKLWGFLQDPYKNSIGAIVREYVSNCFDAHGEADFIKNSTLTEIRVEYPIYNEVDDQEILLLKQQLQVFNNDAVVVSIEADETGTFWKAEDFGVGLSPQRVTDVFCSYLKSTKESTDNLIGAFGIGSKSGLSYADLFFIRTRYNGTEYHYMLRKGETSPRMENLSSAPTTERNGTEIKIYIKNTSDEYRFKSECTRQLAYFDNVYFNNRIGIENAYTILEGENWLRSSNGNPFSGLHLCLGKVAYPIDWDNLGVPSIDVSVALKFNIGELDVIQTREDVRYTPKTKKAIIDKIEALRKECLLKWEKEGEYEIYDIGEYFAKRGESPFIEYHSSDGSYSFRMSLKSLDENIVSWKFMPFDEVGLKVPNNFSGMFFEYHVASQLTKAGLRTIPFHVDILQAIEKRAWKFRNATPYRIRDNHDPKKSKYIREEVESLDVNIPLIRKKKVSLKKYVKELNLNWDNRENWRKQIVAFQRVIQKHVVHNTVSYGKVEVDKQWLKDQYSPRKAIDRRKFVINLYNDDYNRWDKDKWMKGDIDVSKRILFVMGVEEQKSDLITIGNFFKKMHPYRLKMSGNVRGSRDFMHVGIVAPTNLKYLEDTQNLITVGNFKNSRPFQRAMTAYHVRTMPEFNRVLTALKQYDARVWDNVYEPISKMMEIASEYLNKNSIYLEKNDFEYNPLLKDGYEFVKDQKGFDTDFMESLSLIDEYLVNIPMLELVLSLQHSHTTRLKEREVETMSHDIVKSIVMHNCYMPKKQRKKINAYYYALLNANELSWLSPKEAQFITYIQRPKLKI
jgi:hypothetical protein